MKHCLSLTFTVSYFSCCQSTKDDEADYFHDLSICSEVGANVVVLLFTKIINICLQSICLNSYHGNMKQNEKVSYIGHTTRLFLKGLSFHRENGQMLSSRQRYAPPINSHLMWSQSCVKVVPKSSSEVTCTYISNFTCTMSHHST